MRHFTVSIIALAATASAQAPIPIRRIGPILATSTENVGPGVTIRGTSDGHVIVGAGSRQRVYAFDSTLKSFTLVVDSATGTGIMSPRATGVIPYLGDSTLLPDLIANALLVLDATGKQVRSIAPPKPQDLRALNAPAEFGRPGMDAKGRLIYRAQPAPPRPVMPPPGVRFVMTPINPDSVAIVRGDFDTRRIDTLAWMKTPSQGKVGTEVNPNLAGGPPNYTMHMLINPFPQGDEWSLLSDGTIAIVRVHDYHIDWVDPDGSKRSSPKMPIDWRRYSDAEKQQRTDSLRHAIEESVRRTNAARGPGTGQYKLEVNIVPDSEFPSFWPPVWPGSVLADLDGHVWILPTTSTNAGNGFTYDVVNRNGEITERVQLPKDHVLVGFGPHNVVYLTKVDGKNTYLVRAMLSAPSK